MLASRSPHFGREPASRRGCRDLAVVTYDTLPVVASCEAAVAEGGPVAHGAAKDNIAARFTVEYGDAQKAFSESPSPSQVASASIVASAMPWNAALFWPTSMPVPESSPCGPLLRRRISSRACWSRF